jgi:hypothetical protein
VRAALLSEEPTIDNTDRSLPADELDADVPLGDPPDYEPLPERSAAATAAREVGVRRGRIRLELERNGRQFMFAPLANYVDCNFDALQRA